MKSFHLSVFKHSLSYKKVCLKSFELFSSYENYAFNHYLFIYLFVYFVKIHNLDNSYTVNTRKIILNKFC